MSSENPPTPDATRSFWNTVPRWIDLVVVTVLAAIPRLSNLDLAQFDHNQEALLRIVQPIVDGGRWPSVGWEISGLFPGSLPALLFWILALPRFVSESPTLLVGFGALFDVAAALLVVLLGRILLGRRFGFLAGLLYATDAYLVTNSRILWNLTPIPFFTVLMFLGLAGLFFERKSRYAILALLSLSCLTQIHFLTVYFVPVVVLTCLAFRPRVRAKHLIAGLFLAGLLYAPYFYHEGRSGFTNLWAARQIASEAFVEGGRQNNAKILRDALTLYPFKIVTYRLPKGLHPAAPVRGYELSSKGRSALFSVGVLVLLVAVVRGLSRLARKNDPGMWTRIGVFLLLWYYVPLLVLSVARLTVYERYFLPLFPSPLLVLVVPLEALLRWRPSTRPDLARIRRVLVWLSGGLLAGTIFCQLWFLSYQRTFTDQFGIIRSEFCIRDKLRLARFFIETIGMDHGRFEKSVSFFQWPDQHTLERGFGYSYLFRYAMVEGIRPKQRPPKGRSYVVFPAGEGKGIVPFLSKTRVFETDTFTVVETKTIVDLNSPRVSLHEQEGWWGKGLDVKPWTPASLPLRIDGQFWRQIHGFDPAAVTLVPRLNLHVTLRPEEPLVHAYVMVKTRLCPEIVSVDGEILDRRGCSDEPGREELPRNLYAFSLPRLEPGPHSLGMVIASTLPNDSLEIFVLDSTSRELDFTRPPDEALFGDAMPTNSFAIPSNEVLQIPPGATRVEAEDARQGFDGRLCVSNDGSYGEIERGPRFWSAESWQIRYTLLKRDSWLITRHFPFPSRDFSPYEMLTVAAESDGRGGWLTLVVKEADGDEWRHVDRAILWRSDWEVLNVPLGSLEFDPTASGGDGKLDLSDVKEVMIQIIPGGTGGGGRIGKERIVRLGEPYLVPSSDSH